MNAVDTRPQLQTGNSGSGSHPEYLGLAGDYGDEQARRVIAEAEAITASAVETVPPIVTVARGLVTVINNERVKQYYGKRRQGMSPFTGFIAVRHPQYGIN